jgi:hypothetical protein
VVGLLCCRHTAVLVGMVGVETHVWIRFWSLAWDMPFCIAFGVAFGVFLCSTIGVGWNVYNDTEGT